MGVVKYSYIKAEMHIFLFGEDLRILLQSFNEVFYNTLQSYTPKYLCFSTLETNSFYLFYLNQYLVSIAFLFWGYEKSDQKLLLSLNCLFLHIILSNLAEAGSTKKLCSRALTND